jgi:uncharacterized protein with HEPN domain
MRRKRDYTAYLRDSLDAAQKAERFIAGVEFEVFQANDEKVFAVICPLEIIGEASKRIPPARPVTACAICCPTMFLYRHPALSRIFSCKSQCVS